MTPHKNDSSFNLPLLSQVTRKQTFASPSNSSRHGYLLKKPTIVNIQPARLNSFAKDVKPRFLNKIEQQEDSE